MDMQKCEFGKTADGTKLVLELWNGEETSDGWKKTTLEKSVVIDHKSWNSVGLQYAILYGVRRSIQDHKSSEKTLMTGAQKYAANLERIHNLANGEPYARAKGPKAPTVKQQALIDAYQECVEEGNDVEINAMRKLLQKAGITVE